MKILVILTLLKLLVSVYLVGADETNLGEPKEEAVEGVRLSLQRMSVREAAADLSPAQASIQAFIDLRYDRDLVTRFVKACPVTNVELAQRVGTYS